MKKIICLCLALLMVLSLGACKVEMDETDTEGSVSSGAVSIDPKTYDDNLAGLANCLIDAHYISGDPLEMEVSFIGAKAGRKYSFAHNNSPVTVEIYEYDAADADTNEVMKSVAETGTFTILSTEVEAVRSGRYLMVYSDPSKEELNTSRKAAVIELFTGFGK